MNHAEQERSPRITGEAAARRGVTRTGLVLMCLLLAGGHVCGHGGRYRGPGDVLPPGGRAGSGLPYPAAPSELDEWTFWWGFNCDPYLLGARPRLGPGLIWPRDMGKDLQMPTLRQVRDEIAPALLRALRSAREPDILTGCLIALAKIGEIDPGDSEHPLERTITSFLDSPIPEVSETAALALGILGHDSSLVTLRHLVLDTPEGRSFVGTREVSWRTRSFAAYGLALLGDRTFDERVRREIVQVLVAGMRDETLRVRDLRVACVIAMGLVPLAATPPSDSLPDETPPGSNLAAITSRGEQLDLLLDCLADGEIDPLVRAHAPVALVRLMRGLPEEPHVRHKERVASALLANLDLKTDAPFEVARSSILALGLLGDSDDDRIDMAIRRALVDRRGVLRYQGLRRFASIALAEVGGRSGLGLHREKGGEQIAKHLGRELLTSKGGEPQWAALAIGILVRDLDEAEAEAALVVDLKQALRESLRKELNPSVIGAHAVALGLCRDVESAEILRTKLAGMSDPEMQGYVLVGLGLLGKVVQERSYHPALLRQACVAMGLLGDATLIPELVDMLSYARGLGSQAAISAAIGELQDQRSVEPLITMLEDEGVRLLARALAAAALGNIASWMVLPWSWKLATDLNYRAATVTLSDLEGAGILEIL